MNKQNKTNKVRLRFAPSPTGFLHIGNLRTALFGYFIARNLGGDFILRIEDTDSKREVSGAVEALLDVFEWLGLEFDEGPHLGGEHGPYIQSQRQEIYNHYAKELLNSGGAYPCFCSSERLTKLREEQQRNKQAPGYDRFCRHLSPAEVAEKIASGEPYVIRQKMPLKACIEVHDELRGKIKFDSSSLDDQVLIKSNGVPTYQFASVVDDHLMEISHVTRGDEWLSSFPKNVLLYQAFGWQAPKFIHLPLILNKGGGKLSKRQGDVFVEDYRKKGYLPEALINFSCLLGWRPQNEKEILSREEIIANFFIKQIGSSPAVFDETKLNFLNAHYIRTKSVTELAQLSQDYFAEAGYQLDFETMSSYLALAQERMKVLSEGPDLVSFLIKLPPYSADLLAYKDLTLTQAKENLLVLESFIANIADNDWNTVSLQTKIIDYIKEIGGSNAHFLWPLRIALAGLKNSPTPFEIATVLGKAETLARIKQALAK